MAQSLKKTIAQAVGEVVGQRAFDNLGENIIRRLLQEHQPFGGNQSNPGHEFTFAGDETNVGVSVPETRVWGPPGGGPAPPSPGPPSARLRPQSSAVGLMDRPETLRAEVVIFDEFLAPSEMESLFRYALVHESDFQVSEVIRPGATAGVIDYEQRRSRVLMDLDEQRKLLEDRILRCVPRVLARLDRKAFEVSEVEAQVTASNNGDYFLRHNDNSQADSANREITFVYFFHREPKKFRGGELRIYDSHKTNDGYSSLGNYRSVVPQQNQIVFFCKLVDARNHTD